MSQGAESAPSQELGAPASKEVYLGNVDEKTFREVRPFLFRFAQSLGADADKADDLVQDTFVRALASKDTFTPGTEVRAWLTQILRRRFLELKRREKWWSTGDPDSEMRSFSVPSTQVQELDAKELMQLIDKLPPNYRKFIELIGVQEMEYKEAEKILGMQSIKSSINRARRAFATILLEAGYIDSNNPVVVRFLDKEPG